MGDPGRVRACASTVRRQARDLGPRRISMILIDASGWWEVESGREGERGQPWQGFYIRDASLHHGHLQKRTSRAANDAYV